MVGIVLYRAGDDETPSTRPTVTWGGSDGHQSCVYDPQNGTVRATLAIDGDAGPGRTMAVTVTAYADENTSVPVGSGSRTVRVAGTVHRPVDVTFLVAKAPKVDVDGETACRLAVKYGDHNQSR